MTAHDNGAYVILRGVTLDTRWGCLSGYGGKWHLGTYDCEESICGRGPTLGFEECEPLDGLDPGDVCLECVRIVGKRKIRLAR